MKKIVIYLVRNYLNKNKITYRAQVTGGKTYYFEEVVQKVVQRHNVVSATDLKAALMAMDEVCEEIIAEGNNYATNLYYTSFSVKGEFESKTSGYNNTLQSIHINYHPTTRVKKILEQLGVEIVNMPDEMPTVTEVIDKLTKSVNSIISVHNLVQVKGVNIKIDGTDPSVGLFLIDAAGVETKIFVPTNNPSEIEFVVPALPAGEYTLKIVTQYRNNNVGKEVYTGIFKTPLTIN